MRLALTSLVLLALAAPAFAAEKPATRWVGCSSSNFRQGRRASIQRVVIHTVEGSASSAISWFKNPASKVSAHYVVSSDGSIAQCVADDDTAWHAGSANADGIGIEHEGYNSRASMWTDALMRASAKLTRWACDTYGIPIDRRHIVGHSEVPGATHGDPGRHFDWDRYMKLVRGESAPTTAASDDDGLSTGDLPVGNARPSHGDEETHGPSSGNVATGNGGASTGNGGSATGNGGSAGNVANAKPSGGLVAALLPTLEKGAEGKDVRRLQQLLKQAGLDVSVDGDFGAATLKAVKAFQKSKKLDADGIVGQDTWKALLAAAKPSNTGR